MLPSEPAGEPAQARPAIQGEGIVLRATANFFYVQQGEQVFQSQPRGRIKKEGLAILVGDRVAFQAPEDDLNAAVITAVMPRRNRLSRPSVANVDRSILVHSLRMPDLDYYLLDRFLLLVHSREPDLEVLICFTKADLADEALIEAARGVYGPIGYRLAFVSAFSGAGIGQVRETLAGRISVLSGPSGAGKSHLLSAIQPGLKLRYEPISERIGRGRHTTRVVSLYAVHTEQGPGFVVDTPGFSFLDLSHLSPWDVSGYYREFSPYLGQCHYPRCLHWQEPQCAVKENLDQEGQRYKNYVRIIQELQEHHRTATFIPRAETLVKEKDAEAGRKVRLLKLGLAERDPGRRRTRQRLSDYHLDPDELAEE